VAIKKAMIVLPKIEKASVTAERKKTLTLRSQTRVKPD
jgi:hypothetical protein